VFLEAWIQESVLQQYSPALVQIQEEQIQEITVHYSKINFDSTVLRKNLIILLSSCTIKHLHVAISSQYDVAEHNTSHIQYG
jgi:hypothetical protein